MTTFFLVYVQLFCVIIKLGVLLEITIRFREKITFREFFEEYVRKEYLKNTLGDCVRIVGLFAITSRAP